MFGLKKNAVIGLNLYLGAGPGLGTGGGASTPGGRLSTSGKEASTHREVGAGEAGAVSGGSAGENPRAAPLVPKGLRVARKAPIGAEGPDVTATPARPTFFAATRRASPEEMEALAADAIMSPEEELDGYEPEPLGKRPAVLPLLGRVGEASNVPGTDGSLPSTPPELEEED
ncbi:PREDICTED: induced myeloid leukemia cell differentiation protein Mcl-1 homolog, partial [Chrysochloris asiatica]|uniref:Induced myeloid leukemia cell differentiation protein Mcl-1 homolog n=1 Tax=Chrysochloris asiatica TaxID=185453 RepID=A0A9B0TFW6_CHRAS